MKPDKSRQPKPPKRCELPKHWTPEQALAVFEAVEFLRDDLWAGYGPHIQQARREQLRPMREPRSETSTSPSKLEKAAI
ncbi:hypothetical protein ACVBEH_25550, partial [Roseateles sp. GG27B]